MRDMVVDLDGGAHILPSGTIIKPGNAMFVQSWLCVHDPEGSIDTSALPARAELARGIAGESGWGWGASRVGGVTLIRTRGIAGSVRSSSGVSVRYRRCPCIT